MHKQCHLKSVSDMCFAASPGRDTNPGHTLNECLKTMELEGSWTCEECSACCLRHHSGAESKNVTPCGGNVQDEVHRSFWTVSAAFKCGEFFLKKKMACSRCVKSCRMNVGQCDTRTSSDVTSTVSEWGKSLMGACQA